MPRKTKIENLDFKLVLSGLQLVRTKSYLVRDGRLNWKELRVLMVMQMIHEIQDIRKHRFGASANLVIKVLSAMSATTRADLVGQMMNNLVAQGFVRKRNDLTAPYRITLAGRAFLRNVQISVIAGMNRGIHKTTEILDNHGVVGRKDGNRRTY